MSRRKQENPQPRKKLVTGTKIEEWLSPLNNDAEVDTLPDFLTCGICQKDFTLADILKFIQHKVNRCNKENYLMCRENNDNSYNSDDDSKEDSAQINSKRPSISAPISSRRFANPLSDRNRERRVLRPASSSTFLDENHHRGIEESSRKDIEFGEERRPRQVDANTNTSNSEPNEPKVCCTCKRPFTSAWLLLQHVQNDHGVQIYQEKQRHNNANSNCASVANSSNKQTSLLNSSLSSISSHTPSSSSRSIGHASSEGYRASSHHHHHPHHPHHTHPHPHPHPHPHHHHHQQHHPHPGQQHAPSLVGSSPLEAHHAAAAAAAAAAASYNLLPTIAQYPQASVALSNPFSRPSSHDFRFELINPATSISLPFDSSSSGSNAVERSAQYDRSRQTPLSLTMEPQQDFYSQRLRQLAGTTSPAAQQPTNCPSPRKITSPFTTPPLQQPTSQPVTPQPVSQQSSPGSKSLSDHNNKQLKSCEFCGKSFRFQSNLVVHRRSHTGEKPYKCRFCNHACSQASKLKRHMKTHFSKTSNGVDTIGVASPDSSTKPDEKDEMDINRSGSTGTPEIDDEIMLMDDDELDDEEDEEEEEVNYGEKAEDLSTQKSSSPPTSTESLSDLRPLHKQSLVSEVMEKIGLSNIQQYTDAYKQALEERSAAAGVTNVKVKDERPPSVSECSSSHSVANSVASENGNGEVSKSREEKASNNNSSSNNNNISNINNNINHQNVMESGMGLFGAAFESPFDPSKRIKYELSSMDHSREREPLFPTLWVPNPMTHRDLYGLNCNTDQNSYGPPSSTESALQFAMSGMGSESLISQTKSSGSASSGHTTGHRNKNRNDTCEYCGKVFKNCSNLTVHRRSHTGEKPYKCILCSYACAQSSKLTRHMKTHGRLGKDVYKCRFCDMPFSVPSTLEKHMRRCATNPDRETEESPPPKDAGKSSKHENNIDDTVKDRLFNSPFEILQTPNDLSLKKALLAPNDASVVPNNMGKSKIRNPAPSGNYIQDTIGEVIRDYDSRNGDVFKTDGVKDMGLRESPGVREEPKRGRGRPSRKDSECVNSKKDYDTSKNKNNYGKAISKDFISKEDTRVQDVSMRDDETIRSCGESLITTKVGSSSNLLSQLSQEAATAGNAMI